MNIAELDLKDVNTLLQIGFALAAVSGGIAGVVILWIRFRLSDTFATKTDVAALAGTVDTLSTRVEGMAKDLASHPTNEDMRSLRHNVANLAAAFPAMAAKVDGQSDLIRGVDDRLQMVLNELIKGNRA